METRDSETITSTLLKFQNKKLMRSKDFILITILLNLMILVLTFIQEVATFEELEDYEVITISIIIGQYLAVELFAMTIIFFLRQNLIIYYSYWFVVSQILLSVGEIYQTFIGRFLEDELEFIFRIILLGLGVIVNAWKFWGLILLRRKFRDCQFNSSIKLGLKDSNNYTCVLENNVLQPNT